MFNDHALIVVHRPVTIQSQHKQFTESPHDYSGHVVSRPTDGDAAYSPSRPSPGPPFRMIDCTLIGYRDRGRVRPSAGARFARRRLSVMFVVGARGAAEAHVSDGAGNGLTDRGRDRG